MKRINDPHDAPYHLAYFREEGDGEEGHFGLTASELKAGIAFAAGEDAKEGEVFLTWEQVRIVVATLTAMLSHGTKGQQ